MSGFPSTRSALKEDVAEMVRLSGGTRRDYAQAQPVMWRSAPEADRAQAGYFRALLDEARAILLVAERADGAGLAGFVHGHLITAPPVYDPGGPVCHVDDFCLDPSAGGAEIGRALLSELMTMAKGRGAVLVNVVSGAHDDAKNALLAECGLRPGSIWNVRAL
jgi:ribosomal protein S18 acetylase RimI-like enzyme